MDHPRRKTATLATARIKPSFQEQAATERREMNEPVKNQKPRRARISAGLPAPSSIDRNPPHSIEAEQAVLGCILLDPKVALTQTVANFGTNPELFYDLRHQTVFEALIGLWEKNIPINVITLMEALKVKNQLVPVGDVEYLNALPDAVPSAHAIEYFLEIVEEKAALRRLIQACTQSITAAYDQDGTVESIISNAEKQVLAVRRQVTSKMQSMPDLVREANSDIDRLYQSQGAITGASTGLIGIDQKTDGLHGGEMIIIGGFPGGGKTALAVNIIERASADHGIPTAIFSLEMRARRLVLRMLASRAQVNLRSIRTGDIGSGDMEALAQASVALSRAPIHMIDQSDMTISQIRARARQMVQQHGVRMIAVDYLQLIAGQSSRKDSNREQEVSGISRGLKQMALEFDVPVIALSQLNDDGRLRESRAIGQDADAIWILKVKDGQNANACPQKIKLMITKQRDGESPAFVDLDFYKPYTRFEDAPKITTEDSQFKMPFNKSKDEKDRARTNNR
jgi:replicative DNA helicase